MLQIYKKLHQDIEGINGDDLRQLLLLDGAAEELRELHELTRDVYNFSLTPFEEKVSELYKERKRRGIL